MTPPGIYPTLSSPIGHGDTIRTTAAIENEPNGAVTITITPGAQNAAVVADSVETPVASTSGTNGKLIKIVKPILLLHRSSENC